MMVFLACCRDLSSHAVAEAAWGSGDAHVQSTATCQPRPQAFWGPRCSELDPWLRREAKPEHTLGAGATVDVLGTGVPRLACLPPTAWPGSGPYDPYSSTRHPRPSRGSKPREADDARPPREWPSQASSRGAEISRRGKTSRGSRDVIHDDRRQAGASARSVLVSSLVLRRPAQARSTEASGKGCHIGAMRPRPEGRQDGGHRGAQDGVTTRAFRRRRPLLSG